MRSLTPRAVAQAVCAVMGGSTPEAIMASQRGTPRTADLRAVTMYCWRLWTKGQRPLPNSVETGAAFGRDRRNVVRGLQRIHRNGIVPNRNTLAAIRRRLGEGG